MNLKKIENVIANIYPKIDQEIRFAHPKTNLTYSMLSESQLVEMANKTLDIMLEMGIEQVVVSETGAIPFAKICAQLGIKRNLRFEWYSIKIPRNLKECFQVTLFAYLSLSKLELALPFEFCQKANGFMFTKPHELYHVPENYFDLQHRTLTDVLSAVQNDVDFSVYADFKDLTQATGLAQILEKPFIFFDEYLDSGKTLFQTFRFLKLFNNNLKFKIFSYLIKLPKKQINQSLCNSLYTLDNEELAYRLGVYPFENRIDWLGYFYWIDPKRYRKISLSELSSPAIAPSSSSDLLDLLNHLVHKQLIDAIKQECLVQPVAEFISDQHLIQYSFYQLENIYVGNNEVSEFFYQLFDLYGPIWSPLPDQYHLSYLEAFEQIKPQIKQHLSNPEIGNKYITIRPQIIQAIASLIELRHMNQEYYLGEKL